MHGIQVSQKQYQVAIICLIGIETSLFFRIQPLSQLALELKQRNRKDVRDAPRRIPDHAAVASERLSPDTAKLDECRLRRY